MQVITFSHPNHLGGGNQLTPQKRQTSIFLWQEIRLWNRAYFMKCSRWKQYDVRCTTNLREKRLQNVFQATMCCFGLFQKRIIPWKIIILRVLAAASLASRTYGWTTRKYMSSHLLNGNRWKRDFLSERVLKEYNVYRAGSRPHLKRFWIVLLLRPELAAT